MSTPIINNFSVDLSIENQGMPRQISNAPQPKHAPGYPVILPCKVSSYPRRYQSSTVETEDFKWTAIWYATKECSLDGFAILLICDIKKGGKIRAECHVDYRRNSHLKTDPDGPTYFYACFDENRTSICLDFTTWTVNKNYSAYSAHNVDMDVVIDGITRIETFGNLKSLFGECRHYSYIAMVEAMHNNPPDLYARLKNSTMPEEQCNKLLEFVCVVKLKWYLGTENFHKVIRDGMKLGFIYGWHKMLDDRKFVLTFTDRAALPRYQHMCEDNLFAIRQLKEEGPGVWDQYKVEWSDKHPLFECSTGGQRTFDSNEWKSRQYIEWDAYIYRQKTKEEDLLMGGVIFDRTEKNFLAKFIIHLDVDGKRTAIYDFNRVVHWNQRTISFVLGRFDSEMQSANDISVTFKLLRRNGENTEMYETVIESEARDKAEKYKSEPHSSEDTTELPCLIKMPGLNDGFLACRDGQRIAVNRMFLGHHSNFLHTLFYGDRFKDCGKETVKVDEDLDVIYIVLQIVYHKTVLIPSKALCRVIALGQFWMCTEVTKYVELAMTTQCSLSIAEKKEIAITYNLDVPFFLDFNQPANTTETQQSSDDQPTTSQAHDEEQATSHRRSTRKRQLEETATDQASSSSGPGAHQ